MSLCSGKLTSRWVVYIDAADYSIVKERRFLEDMYIYEEGQIIGMYFSKEEADE